MDRSRPPVQHHRTLRAKQEATLGPAALFPRLLPVSAPAHTHFPGHSEVSPLPGSLYCTILRLNCLSVLTLTHLNRSQAEARGQCFRPYPLVHWFLDISRVSKAAGFQFLLWISCSPSCQEEEGSWVHTELLEDLPWENDGNPGHLRRALQPSFLCLLVAVALDDAILRPQSWILWILVPSLFPWVLCPLVCLLLF